VELEQEKGRGVCHWTCDVNKASNEHIAYAGPSMSNQMAPNIYSFKKQLKTYLFQEAYNIQ